MIQSNYAEVIGQALFGGVAVVRAIKGPQRVGSSIIAVLMAATVALMLAGRDHPATTISNGAAILDVGMSVYLYRSSKWRRSAQMPTGDRRRT